MPPGCIQTIWGDDDRFVKTYWSLFSRPVYATFDWGIRDADGYHFILGRTDDVINVPDIGWVRVRLKRVSPVIRVRSGGGWGGKMR